ncbi:hypothetical protein [Gimesia maris]|uniref:Uncharacterized protein n=1 Tax=Gimesia maris TaxID=122 RepID=A0ABX5YUV6_9PLAN|nr:hypothetical protein [Gimesia maris]EDL56980.1 hypothetical protein PM8797T_13715 [Gimesia maris DSM 8797]QEG19400.1 hypothetical protein GmarT_52990 [Gimesia maris]
MNFNLAEMMKTESVTSDSTRGEISVPMSNKFNAALFHYDLSLQEFAHTCKFLLGQQ